jgi:hypothetical protein
MVGGPAGASLGLKAGSTAATLAPIAAGVATGAAVAGAKGEDVLSGALMGGLGGYGGGNLGSSLGKMGAQGGYEAGQAITQGTPLTTAEGMKALEGANPFFGSANTTPSLASRSARLPATFWPFLRRKSIAASKSPLASVSAFLQSIIPAPVIWRNLLTSAAVIATVDIVSSPID